MAEVQKPSAERSEGQKPTDLRRTALVKNRWHAVKLTIGTMACLMCLVAGTVFGHFYWGSEVMRGSIGQIIAGAVHGDPLQNWRPEKQFPNQTTMNVLVLGIDHDYDNKDQIIRNSPGRSDSILMARVDFVNHTISALTIPRDSAVHVPGFRGVRKINSAHSLGRAPLTMATIEQVFGVRPDACVELNFEGFQQLVDAIGGIDVNVQKKLDYDDNWGHLHIHLRPGYQHLNGYQAMGFVRMRHSDSDEMRSKRQHDFLEAVRNKIKEPGTFMSLPRAVDRMVQNLTLTNLNRDQMFALANFARTLPHENIHVETLPSFEGPSYVTINPQKSAEVIQRMFFPNQAVALNIDAPDPNGVRSFDDDDEVAPRHRERRHHARARRTHHRAESSDAPETSVPEPSIRSSEPAPAAPEPSAPSEDHGSSASAGVTG